MKGYHDIGGSPAGPVPRLEPDWIEWEKRVEAIRNLLGDSTRRLVSLDEMRRGFESFGLERYRSLSFYRRRLEAMVDILVEKGVLETGELEARAAEARPAETR